jgi:NOL1/NOP2/fmu family ribosome biogenesis protein
MSNTLRYGINYRTIRYHQKLACDLASYRGTQEAKDALAKALRCALDSSYTNRSIAHLAIRLATIHPDGVRAALEVGD